MTGYFQSIGAVLIAVILILLLSVRDKTCASLLSMAVCALVLILGLTYLEPVVDFIRELEELGSLQSDLVRILLKVGGIGILTEITVLLCSDSGNASLGQSIRTLSSMVILWLSLPVFQALLDLIQGILGGIR